MTIPYMMNCAHDGNGWCLTCVRGLGDENEALRAAIRNHRDQRGDDRCWLDDHDLYQAIGVDSSRTLLPPKCEFLESCSRFYDQRQHPVEVEMARMTEPVGLGKTIAQLEEEVGRLTKLLAEAKEAIGDLVDVQNGPPLITWTERFDAANKRAKEVLEAT